MGPNELAVLVAFRENADQAGLSVEYPPDVLWGDASVDPCGGYRNTHLILCGVSGAPVEANCPSCGAARYLM